MGRPSSSGLRGTVSGLRPGLALTLINGSTQLAISADGPFAFADVLADGTAYSVCVLTQPAGLPCTVQVSAAKAWCNEAYKFVAERAVQIHGAIGMTRDHDVGLYYRRAKAADVAFGDSDLHYERIARQLWPEVRTG